MDAAIAARAGRRLQFSAPSSCLSPGPSSPLFSSTVSPKLVHSGERTNAPLCVLRCVVLLSDVCVALSCVFSYRLYRRVFDIGRFKVRSLSGVVYELTEVYTIHSLWVA